MTKAPKNQGQAWTPADNAQFRKFADGNSLSGLIGYRFGRTEGAMRSHASDLGVSLNPTNLSPCYRRDGK